MPEENSRQSKKPFLYESPLKKAITTPIKGALKSSKSNVATFLEKLKELNTIKEKIKKTDLNFKRSEGKENSLDNE